MKIPITGSAQVRAIFYKITGSGQIGHPGYGACRARVITAARFSTVLVSKPANR